MRDAKAGKILFVELICRGLGCGAAQELGEGFSLLAAHLGQLGIVAAAFAGAGRKEE